MSSGSEPNVANLLGLARTASIGNNMAEAESYYTRVLEIDPTISEAWIGKGKAAGWQSSLSNMRFAEVLTAFGHAIGTASSTEKQKVIVECVSEINKLVSTLYGMARKHMLEFVAIENIWVKYIGQVQQMLSVLGSAHTWLPGDRITLENIVHLCKDNIEGVSYRDKFANNVSKAWSLSPEYEAVVSQKLLNAVEALKQIDPDYSAPQVEKKKPDACFVVTATMGDATHPTVLLMRRFRDEQLLTNAVVRLLIHYYYRFGPAVAWFIRQSNFRRRVSYALVVAPASWIAGRLVK